MQHRKRHASAIHLAHHEIHAADNRRNVGDQAPFANFIRDAQVAKARRFPQTPYLPTLYRKPANASAFSSAYSTNGIEKGIAMPREAKPWYREQSGTWYARINGKRVSLGIQGKGNRLAARRAWQKAVADAKAEAANPKPVATVQSIVDGYLADVQSRAKPNTIRVAGGYLQAFGAIHGSLEAVTLTPDIAERFVRRPEWSASTRAVVLGYLVAAFRWAVRCRILRHNPLDGIRKPKQVSRAEEVLLSPAEHQQLLERASPCFGLLLKVLWACGCRPGEASAITAENFDADAALVRLDEHKTAEQTGKPRMIFLPPETVDSLPMLLPTAFPMLRSPSC